MANSLLGEHLRMENREVVWIVEGEEMKDGCWQKMNFFFLFLSSLLRGRINK